VQDLIRAASLAVLATFLQPSLIAAASQAPGELRWAGDPEGGAPFVEADPSNPDRLVGFDVEIADLIAHRLGRKASFINITRRR
jgi:polar amino acid transport system substrate-binding protein